MSKTLGSPKDHAAEGQAASQDLSFRRRALVEAARYGSDPWVFVRELLQNARDAGAQKVEFETFVGDGMARVICRDDGAGMAYPHAQQYLFALYASSKEEEESQAGQFGIGFWSILRFRPSSIIVRSRRRRGKAWEVSLDGGLEEVGIMEDTEFDSSHGTEIVLERPIDREILGDQVLRAARRHGRFLTRRPEPGRRRGEQELEVVVDGQRINEPFTLPSPSASFEGRGFRGVVGLGSEPSVELFAHGLFVRSAQSLDELLDGARRRRTGESAEDALAELPSLAPQILLDSDEVELLLARSDARQNRHLTQLVRRAEKELSRLVQRKLDSLSPQPWYRVWFGALRERLESLEGRPLGVALVVGLLLGAVLGLGLARLWSDFREGLSFGDGQRAQESTAEPPLSSMDEGARGEDGSASSVGRRPTTRWTGQVQPEAEGIPSGPPSARTGADPQAGIRPYRDLAKSYRGPRVDPVDAHNEVQAVPALRYRPAAQSLLFNALVVGDLASGRPDPVADFELEPYRLTPCLADCLTLEMLVEAEAGLLRLPIPTGHRLSMQEVRLGGTEYPVFETPQGEAVLRITSSADGYLEYQTGPAPDFTVQARPQLQPPDEVFAAAERLRRLSRQEQISGALEWVSERVVYSRARHVVRDFARAKRTRGTFLDAALDVGAGDCDVQNGLLTALLWELGLEARMVLGYVGNRGAVAPGLHAWVEVRGDHGRWQAIDASLETPIHPLDGASPVPGSAPLGLPGDSLENPTEGPEATSAIPANPWWQAPWLPLLVGLALVAAWRLTEKRRRGRAKALDLGEGGDLAALLGGALRHPTAFAAMPAVFHGRFVPLMGGSDALSLHQARKLAEERRLFRSDEGGKLARRAVGRGIPVVDGGTPEGAVLSRAFGAIDLDHWGELLGRCHETESSRRIAKQLQRLGESWRIKEAPELGEAAVEIALEDLRLGHRIVLIDLEHAEFATVRPTAETAQGDFALLDLLTPRLELEPGDQSRVLSHFAARALEEAAGMESRP